MTWFLKSEDAPDATQMDAQIPTPQERRSSGFEKRRIEGDHNGKAWDYKTELAREVLESVQSPDWEDENWNTQGDATAAAYANGRLERALSKVQTARANDPDAYPDLPSNMEEFDALWMRRRADDHREASEILQAAPQGSWGHELIGAIGSDLTDPLNILSMGFGAGAGGVLRTIAAEAALGAGTEALQVELREKQVAEELGIAEPSTMEAALFGGIMGGAFGGVAAGAKRFFDYRAARKSARAEGVPEDVDQIDAALAMDAAEDALISGRPLDSVAPPASSGGLPPVTPDAPENWQAIRGGIFAGESGGDYEALFGYSNRSGGPFSDIKLTDMTVDQALAFSAPNGKYGQWVKGQIGRVATPMGAYQIVGTTLRAAKKGLRLTGNELMTPELQERLGQWIYRRQGTGAWEGYRGPRADWAPQQSATSRRYTGPGQVRAGDDITIDVEYQVVDASTLQRAGGDLQPRDRSRGTSDAWIKDTAARLDPALLMPASTADRGAPIVGPDHIIESGNGRFGAIEVAYERFPDRAAEYRQHIEMLGFTVPEGIERPVLIGRRTSDLGDAARRDFVVAAQDSGVARMTPTEIARTSARAMTADRLAIFDPSMALDDPGNGGFVRSVLKALPRSERNALFDAGGALNAEGRRRLSGAFFARAWNAPDMIQRFAELEDAGELKSLMNAMDRSAPDWATMRAEIEAGQVSEVFDISDFVIDAMRMIAQARDASGLGQGVAKVLAEMLDDIDLLEGAVSPLTVRLVHRFYPDGRAASADSVAGFLSEYAREARQVGKTGDMLGGTPVAVLARLDARFADLPDDLGRPRGAVEPVQVEVTPEATPGTQLQDKDSVSSSLDQDLTALRSEIDGDELGAEFLDREITMDDGTKVTPREILDDLDQDNALIDAVNKCYIGGDA